MEKTGAIIAVVLITLLITTTVNAQENNFFEELKDKIINLITGFSITGFDTWESLNLGEELELTPRTTEEINKHRELLKENQEYTKWLLGEGLITNKQAEISLDLGEFAQVDFEVTQYILNHNADLPSIETSIGTLESYLNPVARVGYSKKAKNTVNERIADLHILKARQIIKEIPLTDITLYKKGVYMNRRPGEPGCQLNFPKITFRPELQEVLNENLEVIGKRTIVRYWKESFQTDAELKEIYNIRGLSPTYEPMFRHLAENQFEYTALLDYLNNEDYTVEQGSENLEKYKDAMKEYEKAIELLSGIKGYRYANINKDVESYRSITLKLAQFYQSIKKYDEALTTYDSVYRGEYPLSKKDSSDIALQKARIERNRKDILKSLIYTEQAIETFPLNQEARNYKTELYQTVLELITQGTSQKYKEVSKSASEELYSWWGAWMRGTSPIATPTEVILSQINAEEKNVRCRLLGLRGLKWAVEDRLDLKSFYYNEVEFPEEMYIEENNKLKIRTDYVMDYGEVSAIPEDPNDPYSPIKIQELFEFYGENLRPETEWGREGENSEKLQIDISELQQFTNNRNLQYQELRNRIISLADKKYGEGFSVDQEFIEHMHECIDYTIRTNPDIALLAASGNIEQEKELLKTMGVWKSGVKRIPKVGGSRALIPAIRYFPEKHPHFENHKVEYFAVKDFVFKNVKHPRYEELYKYTPIHETWPDFFAEQVNLINALMILVPSVALKPVSLTVGGTLYETNAIGAIPLSFFRAGEIVGGSMLKTSGGEVTYFVGSILQRSNSLGLKSFLKVTNVGAGIRSSLMSMPVLKSLQASSPWTFAGVKFVGQTGAGMGVGMGAFITAEIIGGPALSIPVAFVTDIVLGGVIIDYGVLAGARKAGINVVLERGFLIETENALENIVVMTAKTSDDFGSLEQFLKSKGFQRVDRKFPTLDSTGAISQEYPFRTYALGDNSYALLKGPQTREILLESIMGIKRGPDNKIINLVGNGEFNEQLKSLRRKIFGDKDPQTIDTFTRKKMTLSHLIKEATFEELEELTNLRKPFSIGLTNADDIKIIPKSLDRGPRCCNQNIKWELWELLDENGNFAKELRGRDLYVKIIDIGDGRIKVEVSPSETALLGYDETTGTISCQGEKVLAFGKFKIGENLELVGFQGKDSFGTGKYSNVPGRLENVKILGADNDFMEAIFHQTLRIQGYRGINSINMDSALSPSLRELVRLRKGESWWMDHDTNLILWERTVLEEEITNGKKSVKVVTDANGVPQKELLVVNQRGEVMKFNSKIHPRIWKDSNTGFGKVILKSGELKTAEVVGEMPWNGKVALIEEIHETGYKIQYVVDNSGEKIVYNPEKHGHYILDRNKNFLLIEHRKQLIPGQYDAINGRGVYHVSEVEMKFIKEIEEPAMLTNLGTLVEDTYRMGNPAFSNEQNRALASIAESAKEAIKTRKGNARTFAVFRNFRNKATVSVFESQVAEELSRKFGVRILEMGRFGARRNQPLTKQELLPLLRDAFINLQERNIDKAIAMTNTRDARVYRAVLGETIAEGINPTIQNDAQLLTALREVDGTGTSGVVIRDDRLWYKPLKESDDLLELDFTLIDVDNAIIRLNEKIASDNKIQLMLKEQSEPANEFLVRDLGADAIWNREKQIFEFPRPRPLGERHILKSGEQGDFIESPIFIDGNGRTWVVYDEGTLYTADSSGKTRNYFLPRTELHQALANNGETILLGIRGEMNPIEINLKTLEWVGSEGIMYKEGMIHDLYTGDTFVFDETGIPREALIRVEDLINTETGERIPLVAIYEAGDGRKMIIFSPYYISGRSQYAYDVFTPEKYLPSHIETLKGEQIIRYVDDFSGRTIDFDLQANILASDRLPTRLNAKGVGAMDVIPDIKIEREINKLKEEGYRYWGSSMDHNEIYLKDNQGRVKTLKPSDEQEILTAFKKVKLESNWGITSPLKVLAEEPGPQAWKIDYIDDYIAIVNNDATGVKRAVYYNKDRAIAKVLDGEVVFYDRDKGHLVMKRRFSGEENPVYGHYYIKAKINPKMIVPQFERSSYRTSPIIFWDYKNKKIRLLRRDVLKNNPIAYPDEIFEPIEPYFITDDGTVFFKDSEKMFVYRIGSVQKALYESSTKSSRNSYGRIWFNSETKELLVNLNVQNKPIDLRKIKPYFISDTMDDTVVAFLHPETGKLMVYIEGLKYPITYNTAQTIYLKSSYLKSSFNLNDKKILKFYKETKTYRILDIEFYSPQLDMVFYKGPLVSTGQIGWRIELIQREVGKIIPTSNRGTYNPSIHGTRFLDSDGNIRVWNGNGFDIEASPSCFTKETLITMADGSKKSIKDIKRGDRVLSWDFENNKQASGKVIGLWNGNHSDMYVINKKINVSSEHPFWTKEVGWASIDPQMTFERHGWKIAKLEEGYHLMTDEDKYVKVESIKENFREVMTHNIKVEKYENYYAEGILVHNKAMAYVYDKTPPHQQRTIKYSDQSPETIKQVQLELWGKIFLGERSVPGIRREGFQLINEGWILKEIKTEFGRRTPVFAWVDPSDGITHTKVIVIDSKGKVTVRYQGFSEVDPWSRTRSVESLNELHELTNEGGELHNKGYRPYCPDCPEGLTDEKRFEMALLKDDNGIIEGIVLKNEIGEGGYPVAIVIGQEGKYRAPIPIEQIIDKEVKPLRIAEVTDNANAEGLFVGNPTNTRDPEILIPELKEVQGIDATLEIFDAQHNLIHEMPVVAEDIGIEVKIYEKYKDPKSGKEYLYPIDQSGNHLVRVEGDSYGQKLTYLKDKATNSDVYLDFEGGYAKVSRTDTNELLAGKEFEDTLAFYEGRTGGPGAKRIQKISQGKTRILPGEEVGNGVYDPWKGKRNIQNLLEEELESQGIKLSGKEGERAFELINDERGIFYQTPNGEIIGFIPDAQNSIKVVHISEEKGIAGYFIDKTLQDQNHNVRITKDTSSTHANPEISRLSISREAGGKWTSQTYNFKDEPYVFFDREQNLLLEIEEGAGFLEVKARYYKGVSDGQYVFYTDFSGRQKVYTIGSRDSAFVGITSPSEIVDAKQNVRATLTSDSAGRRYELSPTYYLENDFSLETLVLRDRLEYSPENRRLIYTSSESGSGRRFLTRNKENFRILDGYASLEELSSAEVASLRKRTTTLYLYDESYHGPAGAVLEREVLEIRTPNNGIIFIDLRTGKQIIIDVDGKLKFVDKEGFKTEIKTKYNEEIRSLNEEGMHLSTDSVYNPSKTPVVRVSSTPRPQDPVPRVIDKITKEHVKGVDFTSTDIGHITDDPIIIQNPANYERATMRVLNPLEKGIRTTREGFRKEVKLIYENGILRVYDAISGERLVINPTTLQYSHARDTGLSPRFTTEGIKINSHQKLTAKPGQKVRFDRTLPETTGTSIFPELERRIVGFDINLRDLELELEVPPGWNKVGNEESVIRDLFGGVDPKLVKGVSIDIGDQVFKFEINGVTYVKKLDAMDNLRPEIAYRKFVETIKELRDGDLLVDAPKGVVYEFKCRPITNELCTNPEWIEGILITDFVDGTIFHPSLGDVVPQIHSIYGYRAHRVRADSQIIIDILGLTDNKPEHFIGMPERLFHFDVDEVGELNFFISESAASYKNTFTQVSRNGMQQAWSYAPARSPVDVIAKVRSFNTPEFKQVLLERARWYQENRKIILERMRIIFRETYGGVVSNEVIDDMLGNVGKNIDRLTEKYEIEWGILEIDGLTSP